MAGELEMKKFINEKVRPFILKGLPEILQRLDELEDFYRYTDEASQLPKSLRGEDFKTMPSSLIIDSAIDAWKQKTYGG